MIQFPEAFSQAMQQKLKGEWNEFVKAIGDEVPVSIRINPAKGKKEFSKHVPWTTHGFYLEQRPSFTLDPTYHAGTYYVQEASSMFLEQAVKQSIDLTQPLKALDLCAAPGGKSTHLLSLINDQSLLVSNEVIRSRASILSENIQKWGSSNVIVTNNDPEDFQKLTGFFDLILVDAPCSGEGLFRKDPSAMKEWSEDNVTLCAQRQQRILANAWPALKQEGILIYCTCTYNAKENEENLAWLRKSNKVESVKLKVESEWGIEEIEMDGILGYRFYPHKVQGEGFFISVIRKKEETNSVSMKAKNHLPQPPKKIIERLSNWLLKPHEFILLDDLIVAQPGKFITEINWLAHQLNVVTKGTAIACVKHDKLIPEHALALSKELNRENFNVIELDLSQALSYLRKESILIGKDQKGFALVTYQDHPIGWVNLLGNRTNNLYPSNWRIRMSSS